MDIQRLSLFDAIIQANLARRASLKSLAFLKPRPSLQVGLQILSQVVRARNVHLGILVSTKICGTGHQTYRKHLMGF